MDTTWSSLRPAALTVVMALANIFRTGCRCSNGRLGRLFFTWLLSKGNEGCKRCNANRLSKIVKASKGAVKAKGYLVVVTRPQSRTLSMCLCSFMCFSIFDPHGTSLFFGSSCLYYFDQIELLQCSAQHLSERAGFWLVLFAHDDVMCVLSRLRFS